MKNMRSIFSALARKIKSRFSFPRSLENNNLQKGIAMPIIIGIIALIVIIGGISYFTIIQQSSEKEGLMEKEDVMMEKENSIIEKEKDEMMEGEFVMKYSGSVIAGNKSPLLDFNKSDYDTALKTDKLIVLYFYANWCPICKTEVSSSLYPAFNELTTDKVIGFRVNYNDNQTDNDEKNLAREFGVAYQHTKVFVKNGERILKSPESWNEERYLSEINKY